jgi:hypothetical protein
MKKRNFIFLFILILIITACEENVVLDLGKIQNKLVVEAAVSNDNPLAIVSLSYSQGFYDTLVFPRITDATVEIISETGKNEQLSFTSNGFYISQSLQPEFGKKYTLKVITNNQPVKVTSTLPVPVKIKQILQVPSPFYQTKDSINLFVNVDDPKGVDDFFRLKVNRIGWVSPGDYYLMDDSYGKDGVISMPVYYRNFAFGDTAVVELMHINRETYDYYNGLSENVRGSFNSIAPGNPVSNMPDDVYGFFSAFTIDRDTVIIGAKSF